MTHLAESSGEALDRRCDRARRESEIERHDADARAVAKHHRLIRHRAATGSELAARESLVRAVACDLHRLPEIHAVRARRGFRDERTRDVRVRAAAVEPPAAEDNAAARRIETRLLGAVALRRE